MARRGHGPHGLHAGRWRRSTVDGSDGPALLAPRTHTITLIPGDGIGPEVTSAVVSVLQASGVSIDWERHDAGLAAVERTGKTLPSEVVDSIRRNHVALKGPVTTPVGGGFASVKAMRPVATACHCPNSTRMGSSS